MTTSPDCDYEAPGNCHPPSTDVAMSYQRIPDAAAAHVETTHVTSDNRRHCRLDKIVLSVTHTAEPLTSVVPRDFSRDNYHSSFDVAVHLSFAAVVALMTSRS